MGLHRQSFVVVAIVIVNLCLIPLTVSQSSRAPEWKEDSDAYSNSHLKSITKGAELKLLCSAKGHPKPDLSWRKDNVTFIANSEKVKLKGYRLMITDIQPSDHGNYTCEAKNLLGTIEFTILVNVEEAPEWKEDSDAYNNFSMKSVTEGTKLRLSCPAKGNPKPDVFWHRDGVYFLPNSEKVKVNGNNLKFTEIQTSDRGNYTCAANNSVSQIEFTFDIDVKTTTTRVRTATTQTTTTTTTTRRTVPENPKTDVSPKKKKKHNKKDKSKKNKQKKNYPDNKDFDIDNNGDHIQTPNKMPAKGTGRIKNKFVDKPNIKDNKNMKEPQDPNEAKDANLDTNSETGNYDTYFTPHPDNRDNMNVYKHDISDTEARNVTNVASASRGGISIWTVYIIVGAVAGGLLLAGLVAIAIAIFCQHEDESQYKSTSV